MTTYVQTTFVGPTGPVNLGTASMYAASRFASHVAGGPVKNDPKPDAAAPNYGPITPGTAYGTDGAIRFTGVVNGEYYILVELGAEKYWFYWFVDDANHANQTFTGTTTVAALTATGTITGVAATFSGTVTAGAFTTVGTLTVTGLATFGGSITNLRANPRLRIHDTGGGSGLKNWDFIASSSQLLLRAITDDDVTGSTTVFTIVRTGTHLTQTLTFPANVTSVAIGGTLSVTGNTTVTGTLASGVHTVTGTMSVSGQLSANGGLLAQSFMTSTGLITGTASFLLNQASPRVIWHDTGGATDTHRWDITAETVTGTSALKLRMFNDTGAGTVVLTITRTTTYTAATMTIGSAVSLVTVVGSLDVQNGIKLKTKAGAFTDADFPGAPAGALMGGLNTTDGTWEFRDAAGNWQAMPY